MARGCKGYSLFFQNKKSSLYVSYTIVLENLRFFLKQNKEVLKKESRIATEKENNQFIFFFLTMLINFVVQTIQFKVSDFKMLPISFLGLQMRSNAHFECRL